MTIREYANSCGFEIAGKLTKCFETVYLSDGTTIRTPYWVDEAGNEYLPDTRRGAGRPDFSAWCIVTADGGVI